MATHTHNTILRRGGSTVGCVKRISGPNISWSDVDTSCLDVTDRARTFVQGLMDAGELTFDLVWTKAAMTTIYNVAAAGTVETWLLTWPDGSTWSCSGYVKGIGNETEEDDVIMCPITVKLSGKPTYTAA